MKQRIVLYLRILKSIFWKSNDTKWIILMTAFVITVVSAISATSENVEKSFYQALYQTSQYDYMIADLSYQDAKEYLDFVSQKNPGASRMIATGTFLMDAPGSEFYISAIGMEGDCEKIYRLDITEGEFPQEKNEIVLDHRFKSYFDKEYKIGDEIEFSVVSQETMKNEKVCYRICGFFAPENNGGYELYGFTDLQGANQALQKMHYQGKYAAMVCAEETSMDSIMGLLSDLNDELRMKVVMNHTRLQMIEDRDRATSSFANVFRYIGIFIAITSFALLFNMFQMTAVHVVKQLGLMRCIGLNKKQLFCGLFLNLLLYLTSGMGIGFVLYVIFEKLFGQVLMTRFLGGFDISDAVDMQWHFNVASFVQSTLLIFLIMLIVYSRVVIQILRMTPLAAIEYKGEGKITKQKERNKKETLIPFLGKRNLVRNKWRSLYTAITVLVMSFLICTIVTILCNVDLFDMDALKKGNQFDYEFFGDNENSFLTMEDLDRIAGLKGVENVEASRRAVYEFFQEEDAVINADTLVETRVYTDSLFLRICEENNVKYDETQGKATVLRLSNEPVLADPVILYDKQQQERCFPVDAVVYKDIYSEDMPGAKRVYLILNEAAAKEYLDALNYNTIFVSTNEKVLGLNQVERYLQDNGIVMYSVNLKESNSDARTQLQSIICIAIYLVFCVGLMTVVNIACNISINIQMRMREYGIMMSLGMSRKDILRLIIFEIMIVVEKAVLVALPLSVITAFGVVSMIGQEINLLKLLGVATLSSLMVYGMNYLICLIKGSHEFSKNIMGIVRE